MKHDPDTHQASFLNLVRHNEHRKQCRQFLVDSLDGLHDASLELNGRGAARALQQVNDRVTALEIGESSHGRGHHARVHAL